MQKPIKLLNSTLLTLTSIIVFTAKVTQMATGEITFQSMSNALTQSYQAQHCFATDRQVYLQKYLKQAEPYRQDVAF